MAGLRPYDKLTVTPSPRATDLETWVSQTTRVVQVGRAGTALVNAERLLAVVKEMTDDAVSLEADELTSTSGAPRRTSS